MGGRGASSQNIKSLSDEKLKREYERISQKNTETYDKNEQILRDKGYIEYRYSPEQRAYNMYMTEKGANSAEASKLIDEIRENQKEYWKYSNEYDRRRKLKKQERLPF